MSEAAPPATPYPLAALGVQEPPKPSFRWPQPLFVNAAGIIFAFRDDNDPIYHRGRLRYACVPENVPAEDAGAEFVPLAEIDPRNWMVA